MHKGDGVARRTYHQTELKTFLRCGKMWEFRYAKGIKIPPNGAQTVGSSVDTAVSANLSKKVADGMDMSREEILDNFSRDFDLRSQETEWREENPSEQKDVGVELVKLHHDKVAPQIKPVTVQENFTLKTDADYDLGGVIDHTEESGVIVDTKTSRTAYDEKAVARALQPALYDYAFEALRGKPADGFRFDVLIKGTKSRPATLQQVQAKVTPLDREWLFSTISQVHKAISSGVALPAPEGSWYCSKKWCGYWHLCKGRQK